MTRTKSSNHYMKLTWHHETYRNYCPGCTQFRILHKHPAGDYYCQTCTTTINRALRKQGIDPKQLARADRETKDNVRDFIELHVNLIQEHLLKRRKGLGWYHRR